jgi:hypothetical protein
MSDFQYKNQQLILVPYPDTGTPQTASFEVNSLIPVDKIRISVAGFVSTTGAHPGIQVWTNCVNNFIGVIGTKFVSVAGGVYSYVDRIEPQNGIEFQYPNKVMLQGDYNLIFSALDGTIPTYVNPGNADGVFILIEYYQM